MSASVSASSTLVSRSSSATTAQEPTHTKEESSLNATSERFIPRWLIDANNILDGQHLHLRYPDLSLPRPKLEHYSRGLYPQSLIEEFVAKEVEIASSVNKHLLAPAKASDPVVSSANHRSLVMRASSPVEGLEGQDPKGYSERWHQAIMLEHTGIVEVLKGSATRYAQILQREKAVGPVLGAYYSFDAPHLREGWPPVDLGDTVHLIALDPYLSQALYVFDAHVHALRRATAKIIVRCDQLAGREHPSMMFNCLFRPQDRLFLYCHTAVETCRLGMLPSRPPAGHGGPPPPMRLEVPTFPQAWLFPVWTHMTEVDIPWHMPQMNGHVHGGMDSLNWVDPLLNAEQKEAVWMLAKSKRRVPFLISGPPGTGKTKTLAEAVLQILRVSPSAHVLVCAPSGSSADTIASRIAPHLTPTEMLRLCDVSRSFEEVPGTLLPFCHVVEGRFTVPPLAPLLSKRIIVCTVDEAALLVQARCTNLHLARLQDEVVGPLASTHLFGFPQDPGLDALLFRPHFTHCLIDEAAQAHEPQTAIPISVVMPSPKTPLEHAPQLCLCGDTQQLGPTIVSDGARRKEMDCSLLERLLRRAVYVGHPDTRANKLQRRRQQNGTKWEQQGRRDKPFVELVRNYRSHPAILMLPSALYYYDSLAACAPQSTMDSPLRFWPRLPRDDFPLLVVGTNYNDIMVDEGVSWCNQGEVDLVCSLVQDLVTSLRKGGPHGTVQPEQISVITPFREQVWRIRLKLRGVGLAGVDVGNVEALQGKENRIVFISTVRASLKRIEQDQANSRGLIFHPRRTNVALTRAMELLVVVGNVRALSVDPDWRAYLAFAQRCKVYEGVPLPSSVDDAMESNVSYMEEAFSVHDEDEGLRSRVLAGAVANSVLRE